MRVLCPAAALSMPPLLLLLPLLPCHDAQAQSPELLNPLLLVTYPTAALASIGVSAATLIIGFQQAGISSPASAWSALVGSGLSPPKSAAGWAYSVFLLLYAATGEAGRCACVTRIASAAAVHPVREVVRRAD